MRELEQLLRSTVNARVEDPESRANSGYELLSALRDDVGGMLLLTATPMQLHDFELYSMIELVEPGLFRGYADFEASRAEIAAINRAVTALRTSSRLSAANAEFCRGLMGALGAPEDVVALVDGTRSDREGAAHWLSRCHRLSTALVRNRKAEIGGFTSRVAHRIDVTPGAAELELEADVQDYIRTTYARADAKKRTAVGLVLVAFQKMLCSSTMALAGALESRARRLTKESLDDESPVSDDAEMVALSEELMALSSGDSRAEAAVLMHLASRARAIEDAKLVALEKLVDRILKKRPDEKILIFSQYLGSIEMIRRRLNAKYSVRTFHGGMSRDEKEQAHQAFRGPVQVLVSSEAGGEGRNFQFCHNLVNYDLPWNPMKIEQRIGRLDRVGQRHDVHIYNFAVKGMLDERILDVLEHRIRVFTETVGALDPILESLEDEISRIALEDGSQSEGFHRLDVDLETKIARARALEDVRHDFVLDWRSMQRDDANRLLGRQPRATRDDVETFCRSAIARYTGIGQVEPHAEGGLFVRVPGRIREARPEIVDEDYRGTFDVTEALLDERLQFFAVGHPLVEAILDNVGDPWWSPVSVLESPDWTSDAPAVLVDYRFEFYGIRDSGALYSHLVTDEGVKPEVRVMKPRDPGLEATLAPLSRQRLERFKKASTDAARREAFGRFEAYKSDHAALVEKELERLTRLFDSRRSTLDDRVARNRRKVAQLESAGTVSQRRIIPALEGQVTHDERRLKELEKERRERVDRVQATIPSLRITLLGATVVVPPGRLERV